jgi:hypothetical protein
MTKPPRHGLLVDSVWAFGFALVGAGAVLWNELGHHLGGALSITLMTQPGGVLQALGGPDISAIPWASVAAAAMATLVVSLLFLVATRPASERRRRIPGFAIALGILLLIEVVYLVTGEVPREKFRGLRLGYLVSVHLACLALVVAYVASSARSAVPGWAQRWFWFLIFILGLVVLFPATDSL